MTPSDRESACFFEGERLEKLGGEMLEKKHSGAEDALLKAAYHFLMCGALEHAKSSLATLAANYGKRTYASVLRELNYARERRILTDLLRGRYRHGAPPEKIDVLDMFLRETSSRKFANRTSEKWHHAASRSKLYDREDAHGHRNVKVAYLVGLAELLKKASLEEERAKELASFLMLNPNYAIDARKKIEGLE